MGSFETEAAQASLIDRLDDPDIDVRLAAFRGLAQSLDKIDRELLTGDLDNLWSVLDPSELITRRSFEKQHPNWDFRSKMFAIDTKHLQSGLT